MCVIKYARVQGKEALVNHFRNSKFPSDDQDCLPVIFNEAEVWIIVSGLYCLYLRQN